jgi:HTH-type transcriptional regulator, sugar sensing transcriptional regulator
MITESWIGRLRGMGFTNYEARVYLALLGEESLTVADIVRKSGVPQPKIYEATRVLTERGFAEKVLGGVQAFRAVEPQTAFNNHRERTQRELDRQAVEMQQLQSAAPKAPRVSPDTWGVRVVQGTANVRAARTELARNVKEELVQFIKPPLWQSATPVKAIVSEPPKYRLYRLLEASLLKDPEHGETFEFMAATEAATRVVPMLPMKMSIYDRKVMIFPLQDHNDGACMIIPQPELAEAWALWAIHLWENTKPYGAARTKRKARARKT